jgi:uncharacterized membrane protein (Fun14 family)
MNGAIARIIIRYGVGAVMGLAYGNQLAADPDIVMAVAALIGIATEAVYALAKRKGWAL